MADFKGEVEDLRQYFNTGATKSNEWRSSQLKGIIRLIEENKESLKKALYDDLHQDPFLQEMSEINIPLKEAQFHLDNLSKWTQPNYVDLDKMLKPATAYLLSEPLGVVLIISPWNYPLSLILKPLIGAISAGNCVLIKPSEISANTSNCVAQLIPKYLDTTAIRVIEGGPEETTAILKERFDHIFYTGSTLVGKIIMKAAAEHLTPVTLELGGKTPCIIDKEVDIQVAARRIIIGKFGNCGQTCVAPDYLLVFKEVEEELIKHLIATLSQFYGENPQTSQDYGRIISERHSNRLASLLEGQEVIAGGRLDIQDRYLEPTLVKSTLQSQDKIMQEEIFGPILPIISISNLDEALRFINERPKPLALYVFSSNSNTQQTVISNTSSGSLCVNDCVIQVSDKNLPFGGIGASGIGRYNGKTTFDTFSNFKSVMTRPTWIDPSLRYPPFTAKKLWWLRTLSNLKLPSKMVLLSLVPAAYLTTNYLRARL